MTIDSQQQQSKQQSDLRIIRASGSLHNNPVNGPENLVNTNPTTYFSSEGIGSYFDLEIKEKAEFNTLLLGFYRGLERKTKFTVTKTDDFCSFEPVEPHQFVSSGDSDNPQKFHFKTVHAKGVRVSFDGNLDNGHVNNTGVIDPLFLKQQQQLANVHLSKSLVAKIPAYNNNATNGTITNLQSQTNNITATQASNSARAGSGNLGKDFGINCQYFSIFSAALLNEELPESENEKLDKILKEIEELEKKEEKGENNKSKCIRCGSDECEKGVCTKCGITADYNHITYNYISENFPVSYDVTNNSFVKSDFHIVDTTPSASVPAALHSNTNKSTAPLADKPAGSGNVSSQVRKQDEQDKAEQQKINDSSSGSSSIDKDNALTKAEQDNVFKKPNTTQEQANKSSDLKNKSASVGSSTTDEKGNNKDKIVTTTQTTTEAKEAATDDKNSKDSDITLKNTKNKSSK